MTSDTARICAVITEPTTERARAAIKRAATVADLIELRLDYLHDFDFANLESLRALIADKPLPTIITCRAVEEGGQQYVADDMRLRLLVEGARGLADYCDIEAAHYSQAATFAPDLQRLIVSHHNFDETPFEIDHIFERIIKLPAAIHKLATRANHITDALAIFHLLDRARREGKPLIAIAMQEPGLMTRVLGPSFGSFLTYGAMAQGRESAPGQLTCEELRDLYRIHRISRETEITGIIGQPVSHSVSPLMHNRAFAALGLDYVYLPFAVSNVAEFFARFVRPATREIDWRLRGLSVTIPHKTAVIGQLDEIDSTAAQVGAVNTVVIRAGKLIGYNTDVAGAMEPLEKIGSLKGVSCAVVGAGGAARAVVYGLVERGAQVKIFARDANKARPLAESFGVAVQSLDALAASDAEIIINTTPVGMHGYSETHSPVPRAALRNRRIAFDLVYNPLETRFLKEAREEGCQTISGIDMLVAQAALQFALWTGQRPPLELLWAAVIEKLTPPGA